MPQAKKSAAKKSIKKPKVMDKVKIKRVKRIKKKTTAKEKVLAGLGLGSTLLGGAGIVAPQPKTTQFVRTQETEAGTVKGRIQEKLKDIFGVKKAKAMAEFYGTDDAPARPEEPDFLGDMYGSPAPGAVVDASTNIAPSDVSLSGNALRGSMGTDSGSGYNATAAATGGSGGASGPAATTVSGEDETVYAATAAAAPSEGDTKEEGGFGYVFYQG
jgi:hypothetical protein